MRDSSRSTLHVAYHITRISKYRLLLSRYTGLLQEDAVLVGEDLRGNFYDTIGLRMFDGSGTLGDHAACSNGRPGYLPLGKDGYSST